MRKWTLEERQSQAELIRHWQPWKKAGVKTADGKMKSRMNALKHGLRSEETREMRRALALCKEVLEIARERFQQLANLSETQ